MRKFADEFARPFAGLRPAPGRAAEVAAPPYDVVTGAEARALIQDKPYSFLRVSRAEVALAPDTDPYSDVTYATAAQNLSRFENEGVLIRDKMPAFYVYRMTKGNRVQTGVVHSASIEAYLRNRIRKHELTRPAKENDRVRQIEAVAAITGPVLVVYRSDPALAAELSRISSGPPDAAVPNLGGVRHEMWVASGSDQIERIATHLNKMDAMYIADGHHRSAAAARITAARREAVKEYDGSEPYNGFLAVSFPDDEVTILDYNRLVRDLDKRDADTFLTALRERCDVRPCAEAVRPTQPHHFGMYLEGNWYELSLRAPIDEHDPVERLDVQLLDRSVLQPLLGVGDPRTDPRIDFVGGSRGTAAIAARVDSGEMAIGFTLFPTSLADLMAVADAGRIMPPKSTWFDPKLADGLISLPLS